MKKLTTIGFLLSFLIISCNAWANYDYPIKNKYVSTVIGTPTYARLPLSKLPKVQHRKISNFNKKDIPDVFWFQNDYGYSISAQDGKAPLIFVIPGMGGYYDSGHTVGMRDILYDAGYHVVTLSNPSHPSFLISASSTGVIGLVEEEASDFYKLMKAIYNEVKNEIEISENYLVAYSMGATYSSYLGKLDKEEKFFNFNKIFLINPSVNLIDSAVLFDSLIEDNLPNGMSDVNKFIAEMEKILIEMPYELDATNLRKNTNYLLNKNTAEEDYQKMIGMIFRNAILNVVFVSDVLTRMGHIVPKDRELTRFSSLTEYYEKSSNYGFFDYFRGFLVDYLAQRDTGYNMQDMLELASLEKIEDFLKNAENIYVVTNKDELILTENDFKFLERTFKDRAKFYPVGGHCGNIFYKDNINYMLSVLSDDI